MELKNTKTIKKTKTNRIEIMLFKNINKTYITTQKVKARQLTKEEVEYLNQYNSYQVQTEELVVYKYGYFINKGDYIVDFDSYYEVIPKLYFEDSFNKVKQIKEKLC